MECTGPPGVICDNCFSLTSGKAYGEDTDLTSDTGATSKLRWLIDCEWWDNVTKVNHPNYFSWVTQLTFWFDSCRPTSSLLSLSGTVIWIRSPCSSHFSVSLPASSRQNKPGTFDSIVMDDFSEWKMTGYFPKSITAAATGLSQKGSVEQRRNLGDFVWSIFDAARDWLYEFHLCVSISALSCHVSLDHIHCLSQFLHSFPLLGFAPLFSFGFLETKEWRFQRKTLVRSSQTWSRYQWKVLWRTEECSLTSWLQFTSQGQFNSGSPRQTGICEVWVETAVLWCGTADNWQV